MRNESFLRGFSRGFWKRPQAVLCSLALASALGGVGYASATHLEHIHALALKLANPEEGPSQTGFAPVVKKVLPAVVNISSSKIAKVPTEFQQTPQLPDDQLFRQFFGNNFDNQFGEGPDNGQGNGNGQFGNRGNRQFRGQRQVPEQRETGVGSGVILTQDGYIVTNNHVVDGASSVTVTLSDKREFKAKVIGTDAKSDIAVIKIDAGSLPCITVADSSKVQVGDYALAVGDPFGVGQTVTMGIVSATGRSHLGIEDYENFIQTDAPINPGNSGGALVNDRGELIGINTAIIAHGSEGNQGIGFAIPANMARSVMEQIVDHGKVTRAYLGILPQDVTPDLAKQFGEKEARGALVAEVTASSPAEKSGLQRGDIVLDVNGKPVTDSNDLRMTISMMAPDSDADLKVLRNGSDKDISVKLSAMPAELGAKNNSGDNSEENGNGSASSALSGVSVENLDAQAANELGLSPNTKGVVVTKVDPSSEAAEAGLRRGDVIQEANRQPVTNTAEFERAMHSSNDKPLLLVNRNGSTMYLTA
jgi:serine protease Do